MNITGQQFMILSGDYHLCLIVFPYLIGKHTVCHIWAVQEFPNPKSVKDVSKALRLRFRYRHKGSALLERIL